MGDGELLDMLAAETDRRSGTIINGVQALASSRAPDPDQVEALRVEAHGLKGAAMVVGQDRLAELARLIEQALADRTQSGEIDQATAAAIVDAIGALHEGTQAAAQGRPEPPAIASSLTALGG